MNEFPPKYNEVVNQASGSDVPLVNGSEYLEYLFALGIKEEDLPVLQPIKQQQLWERFSPGDGSDRLDAVINELKQQDHRFHMEGGSWTNNISWVRGYENLLGPMDKASSLFNEKVLRGNIPNNDNRFRTALFLLMTAQTSCFRYWGQGQWTDYGRELCRRAEEFINRI
ncbi:MAG TPA: glycosyl hydrolase family 57, partial [Oligoflexia bacterium]|nr:glycosyl hydrolase family 57 [Oligoflexia bacterium]